MSNHHGNEYGNNANTGYYGQQTYQDQYSSYQPPRDDNRHDQAVTRYDEDRARYNDRYNDRPSSRGSRRHSRGRYEDDGGYEDRRYNYDERDSYKDRSRSRRRSKSSKRGEGERGFFGGEGGEHHNRTKDVGATLIGGAVGAFAGREFGHNGIATLIGTAAGAFAGHELEKRYERKKERKEFEQGRRSGSRSRNVEYESDEDEYDDRRQHGRRD